MEVFNPNSFIFACFYFYKTRKAEIFSHEENSELLFHLAIGIPSER